MHAHLEAPHAPSSRSELYRCKTLFLDNFPIFVYPNVTWTHPPTSKLFLDSWRLILDPSLRDYHCKLFEGGDWFKLMILHFMSFVKPSLFLDMIFVISALSKTMFNNKNNNWPGSLLDMMWMDGCWTTPDLVYKLPTDGDNR